MADVVLDASALLALINNERGADRVAAAVADAIMSTVNLAEVLSKLVEKGMSVADATLAVDLLAVRVVDFTRSLAEAAGVMVVRTRRHGLSLGDRACLALAAAHGLPALTADRSWRDMDVGVEIALIR
jgi:ribonuclease VapC